MSKVIIFGSGGWAQYLHHCLTHDSPHEVVAFTVDGEYVKEPTLLGLPVVPFEDLPARFHPETHRMLVGLSYQQMNRLRQARYAQAKAKGYELISYVSSRAEVAPGVELGDNCLILEKAIVQPFVRIGADVTVCAAAIVGHHTTIRDHAFVAPAAVLLGLVGIGERCLIGANSTVYQGIQLEEGCLIGMGVCVNESAKAGSVFIQPSPEQMPQTSDELIPFLRWS
ncbi:acetyltransferase [Mesoterricola sediminis]|uniref:Uncharacterized protein n=1 Tax=Mesoterricola sediminis TaxID=2927980 RepID=A0AA48KDL7_9BACT|nr:acetyltransferase [Mesoterricola sediminis]BDU76462.1 hypothetical protein METESE_14200 [Mesoterricola sediminis]